MILRLTAETFSFALCTCANCSVIVDSTSSWRVQASPTRPEQPSLASVRSSMAAGAAFAHPPVREPPGRPIFCNHF